MHDVIVIGSGPAGLTAGLYASRAELKTLIIAGSVPGGQLTITSEVENYPGFPEGLMGPDLMNKMIAQSTRFGAKLVQETVQKVSFQSQPFVVETENARYEGRSVVIATGADAKWLGLENEQRLRGRGVSACATCDGFFFKGKSIVVIGGGDSAMEEALFLTKFATKVTIIHRREEFRASKIMLTRARNNLKIEFIINTEILDILGQEKVSGVHVKDAKTGQERDIVCEGVFLAIGHQPNTKIFEGQLAMDERGYIKVENNTRTSVAGVFCGGDASDHRYRQAVTAAGLGCMATIDAEKWLSEQDAKG